MTCTIVFCSSLLTVSRAFCITLNIVFEICSKTSQKQAILMIETEEAIIHRMTPCLLSLSKFNSLAVLTIFGKRTKFYLHPYICTLSVSIWGRIWLKRWSQSKDVLGGNHRHNYLILLFYIGQPVWYIFLTFLSSSPRCSSDPCWKNFWKTKGFNACKKKKTKLTISKNGLRTFVW